MDGSLQHAIRQHSCRGRYQPMDHTRRTGGTGRSTPDSHPHPRAFHPDFDIQTLLRDAVFVAAADTLALTRPPLRSTYVTERGSAYTPIQDESVENNKVGEDCGTKG